LRWQGALANLVALCRRHHRLKTFAGFTTEQQGDGAGR
jgi:hypothetical protein